MNHDQLLSFDDVLIEPQFSFVRSRKDVDVSTDFLGMKLSLPVINSNMDTVASSALCKALTSYGMVGSLHRFWSIEENVKAFVDSVSPEGKGICPIVSIGIGDKELERAKALYKVGASRFMLDVAHAANVAVVEMYDKLIEEFPNCYFIVGDFGTGKEIKDFINHSKKRCPDAVKVGISVGSVCITRLTTGVGTPAISCLLDCAEMIEEFANGGYHIKLVLDGGVKYIGDIAKALIAGADIILSGSMFAGADEAPGVHLIDGNNNRLQKEYRGSASLQSYEAQGKVSPWRAPEGESTWIKCTGPVINTLNNISGGLRSSCSYVNAFNLDELKANGKLKFTTEKKVSVNV